MVARRGDGVGLEVTRDLLRGVRLSQDEPGRVVDVCEVPIARFDDDDRLREALVVARERLHLGDERTRIAWFPGGSTLRQLDVTGRDGPELNVIRHDLDDRFGISSTMLLEGDARRWMLALHWSHRTLWRIQGLAELAGYPEVEVEPAPLALGRVLPSSIDVARHAVSGEEAWAAVYRQSVPLAATSLREPSGEYPSLEVGTATRNSRFAELAEVQSPTAVFAAVTDVVAAALDLDAATSAEMTALRLADHEYPAFPPHDLRAPRRVCVALGAALGAAGLAGHIRAVDVLAPTTTETRAVRHPWSVERVIDAPEAPERIRLSWWRRVGRTVTSPFRRVIRRLRA